MKSSRTLTMLVPVLMVLVLAQQCAAKRVTYDRLLTMYRTRIDKVFWRIQHTTPEDISEEDGPRIIKLGQFKTMQGGKVIDSESSILSMLRVESASRPGGKLDFREDRREFHLVIPASDASARVFSQLERENRVDVSVLIEILSENSSGGSAVSNGWIPLLEKTAKSGGGKDRVLAASMLYAKGVGSEVYRPVLEKRASGGDTAALSALLFKTSASVPFPPPVRSANNIAMARRFVGEGYPPMVRVECATYLAELGDRETAEAVCEAVLWTPILTDDHSLHSKISAADDNLGGAKDDAMDTLFYVVRTETAFKNVYKFAEIWRLRDEEPASIPIWFVHNNSGTLTSMNIERAQGLIGNINPDQEDD